MTQGWNASDIPDQSGRTAVVTGANSGIGLVTARELARSGARVLLACRDETRGKEAESRLRAAVPGAEVEFAPLDPADLSSVREFAASYRSDRLDLLINNAGVMALPWRGAPAPSWRTGWTRNDVASERLWVASEQLTGVTWPGLTP